MSSIEYSNIDTNPPQLYDQYQGAAFTTTFAPTPLPGTISITSINGITGPTISITGGTTGYDFTPAGATIQMVVSNAATVRSAISAAKSGANSDLTSFTALTGNTGVHAWTGTPNGSSQVTYPVTTASVLYVQAEMQGLMDKMKQTTEFMMFLVAALLAPGVVET